MIELNALRCIFFEFYDLQQGTPTNVILTHLAVLLYDICQFAENVQILDIPTRWYRIRECRLKILILDDAFSNGNRTHTKL